MITYDLLAARIYANKNQPAKIIETVGECGDTIYTVTLLDTKASA